MKKRVKKSYRKSAQKKKSIDYKLIYVLIILILIILFVFLLVFYKPLKNERGLPSLGVGKIEISAYNTDPLGLADFSHVLFIDRSNPNCSDSYNRTQVLNPATPWCDTSVFGIWGATSLLIPGDKVYFKNGTYYGEIYIGNIGNSSSTYTIFEPYPGNNVNLIFGKEFTNWSDLGNRIYTKTVYELDNGTDSLNSDYLKAIKPEGYGIMRVNSLDEIYNPNVYSSLNATDYDFFFVNATTKQVYLRLVNETPENIYFTSSKFEIDNNSPYIEINGFTIMYGYDGIKYYSPHIRIINNTIMSIDDQGIIGSTSDVLIQGNNINYIGEPLKYNSTASNLLVKNNLQHAMYIGGDGVIIKNNHVSKCNGQCMHPWEQNPPYPNNFSIFSNIVEGGFVLNGNDFRIYNNIIYDNLATYPSSNIKIYNNLIIGSDNRLSSNNSNITMQNNIIEGTDKNQYCIYFYSPINYSSSIINNNLYYNCTYFVINYTNDIYPGYLFDNFSKYKTFMYSNFSLENNSIYTDPLLNGTFGLLSGSPAIDNGTCINGINSDFYGNLRYNGKSCDIGPFEFNIICGDSVCNSGENCSTCPTDCGNCTVINPCGNGICNSDENCTTCPTDCGNCANSTNYTQEDNITSGDFNADVGYQNTNNSVQNNMIVNLPANSPVVTNLSNKTTVVEIPKKAASNSIIYILATACIVFIMLIIILLIVRSLKNKKNKSYTPQDNFEYLKGS